MVNSEWEAEYHVVGLEDGWVCEKIAKRLARELGATISREPRADRFNIYVPYLMWNPGCTKGLGDIALFTHREQGDTDMAQRKRTMFDAAAHFLDGAWCMSHKTKMATDFAIPTMVQHLAADDTFNRGPLVLGVCAQEYVESRKNLSILDELTKTHNATVCYTGGALPDLLMASWMQAIDYLVVTGQNEGGPMPVLEAMAMGKPVIAPDVGWCWDYPVIRYESDSQLLAIVRGLATQPSWSVVAHQVAAFARDCTREVAA